MTIANNSSEIILIPQDPNEPHSTTRKILSFKKLKSGWHFGEGDALKGSLIEMAISLNNVASSLYFYKTDAFPLVDGSIAFTVYEGEDYLEFTLNSGGGITYCRETNDEDVHELEDLTFEDSKDILKELRNEKCRQFASYTSIITTTTSTDLLLEHSDATKKAFPLLT